MGCLQMEHLSMLKGGILYNHLIEKKQLSAKYPYIQEGDKIKFLHHD